MMVECWWRKGSELTFFFLWIVFHLSCCLLLRKGFLLGYILTLWLLSLLLAYYWCNLLLTFVVFLIFLLLTRAQQMTLKRFCKIAFIMKARTLSVMTWSFRRYLLLLILLHELVVLVVSAGWRSQLTIVLIFVVFAVFSLPLHLILLTFIVGIKKSWLLI